MIEGRGVAAVCLQRLLPEAGFGPAPKSENRPRVPALVLGQTTQRLLRDTFGRPELFRHHFEIDRRIVMWGGGSAPVEIPHRAVVVSEEALIGMLEPQAAEEPASGPVEWTVYASRPTSGSIAERHFGSRHAFLSAVRWKGTPSSACWIESLASGWLFVVPESATAGWLLAVGDATDRLLARSRLIADHVEVAGSEALRLPAHPRLALALCGPGWLAAGGAAMAFDPLCGDGTGNAVREAILAAAVVRAAHRGESPQRLLTEYRARLIGGLLRHLELCRSFYDAAHGGPWWAGEIAGLTEGIRWCRDALREAPPFAYCLNGFDLEAVS